MADRTPPDRPDQEARRLALVRRLGMLDTPPDERFDVFTRLAASVARTPVAIISLVDEHRVWFKSAHGLPDNLREVPRDVSACAHVLHVEAGALVVPDARLDPRLAGSPLVTGAFGMRFYAGVPLRAPTGEVLGALCVIDRVPREPDPATLRALEDLARGVSSALRIHETSERALRDPLTGLGNRRILEEALEGALDAAHRRTAQRAVGLLLLDLDRFRRFNELLGHEGGDAVLKEVGQRLALALRETDVVARLGRDEFALLATLRDGPGVALAFREIGDRILQALRGAPVRYEGQDLQVTGSVGVAFASHRAAGSAGFDPKSLVRSADAALYAAKRDGRNRVVVSHGGGISGIGSKNTVAKDLRAALARGGRELSLEFQPLRACADGVTVTGFETLLRWTHPDYGPVSPGDFIRVAERTGLAAELDRWVLREACRQAMRFPAPRPTVAVNVTPSFLVAPDFLDTVERALAESGLPHDGLCIELTERVFLGDRVPAVAVTGALLARGVQVALDDFGAGHAGFGYLAELGVTKVKVDGGLIAALHQETDLPGRAANDRPDRAAAILRGIVTMARGLGLGVVAEGVESAAQLRRVRELGCDEAQGWHLGHPAPLEHWITACADLPQDAA